MASMQERRAKLHEIIFEADTPTGKTIDITILGLILFSVLVVMLESSSGWSFGVRRTFVTLEWVLTIILQLNICCGFTSLCGHSIMCLASMGWWICCPFYLLDVGLFLSGGHSFAVIRALRLLRVFRIFKLGKYLNEGDQLRQALVASRNKIAVFLFVVSILVLIIGSVMHLVEGGTNEGFTSIPRAVYWAIVTLTTVGYGDITPSTNLGQFISALVMILGYAIIAVPTGIVTNEMMSNKNTRNKKLVTTQNCRFCSREGHDSDATYCKYCGGQLDV